MRSGTPPIQSTGRTLAMLEAIIADRGRRSIAVLARENDMPVSTAHRQVTTLVREGYLVAQYDGGLGAGPRLLRLLHLLDDKQRLVNVAAPILDALATQIDSTVQLGTLENDMVTYRIKTGKGAAGLFTKVGMQLEAYCSAIGKVLLAALPASQREAYLNAGPFVALTPRTITDPAMLAQELLRVRRQDHAIDDGEIADGLACAAVPIRNAGGQVIAAVSASQSKDAAGVEREALIRMLHETSHSIRQAAFPLPSVADG